MWLRVDHSNHIGFVGDVVWAVDSVGNVQYRHLPASDSGDFRPMNHILAIVTNYCRPSNIPAIVAALHNQTVRVDVVVVDNSPRLQQWECDTWDIPDDGYGPPNRFLPAFRDHRHEFCLFIDDDLLPGMCAVEHLCHAYEWMDGKVSTIGEIGRIHTPQGEYARRNIRRHDSPRRVDMTARAHFVRTEYMRHVLNYKWELINRFGDEARELVSVHDDILLNCAVQMETAFPSCLTAADPDVSKLIRTRDLPDGGGVSARAGFLQQRHRLIQMFQAIGWRSLV